jgi:hypothetical protein
MILRNRANANEVNGWIDSQEEEGKEHWKTIFQDPQDMSPVKGFPKLDGLRKTPKTCRDRICFHHRCVSILGAVDTG